MREDVKAVGATWHRGAIFLVWFYRKSHPMIMVSRSKDGDLIAGYAEKLGVIPVRGSSSRGGREAFKKMLYHLQKPAPRKVATVLDGPRGPMFVAKKGMLMLSMYSGVPLVPVIVSAKPAVTLKKTWDKTLIPLPFSRVTVMYGKPMNVPRNLSRDQLETARLEIQNILNRMVLDADRDTGYSQSNDLN